MTRKYSNIHSDIWDGIAEHGWAVSREFLPADAIEALAEEARQLWLAGRFSQAGVGRGSDRQIRSDVRSDRILWLDEGELTHAQSRYWAEIEELRAELNRELFLGLASFESHYAFYPPGAFYEKHVDRFSSSDARVISCSLYLNSDWKEEDGGQLSLYVGEEQVEIFPQAGAFVIFRSDNVPHEVAPARRDRFSLTGWFRRRSPGIEFG
ncbi:MAG: 2OG-Fe(II) oxygenase [Blastocatellales bacterium]